MFEDSWITLQIILTIKFVDGFLIFLSLVDLQVIHLNVNLIKMRCIRNKEDALQSAHV